MTPRQAWKARDRLLRLFRLYSQRRWDQPYWHVPSQAWRYVRRRVRQEA